MSDTKYTVVHYFFTDDNREFATQVTLEAESSWDVERLPEVIENLKKGLNKK